VAVVAVLPDGQIGSSVMTWKQDGPAGLLWKSTEREVGGDLLPDAEHKYQRVR